MNKDHKETLNIRLISCAFMVLAIAIFKPFGLEAWQWQAYIHLLAIFALGLFSCFLTEIILRYIVHMPRSYDRGVSYIISRNLRFQCINTPLVSLLICLYRHLVMSVYRGLQIPSNVLSLTNYLETLVIIAFLSFAIGLYWRFKFRSRYLAAELEETKQLNEQLKKLQTSTQDSRETMVNSQWSTVNSQWSTVNGQWSTVNGQWSSPLSEGLGEAITLEGTTNEHVTLEISNLLYIEAVGNYVKIVSMQDNEMHTNMLRATMKQMEETLQSYPMIVRCHRAFMVNLGQVDQISSNSRVMQLVMRHSRDAIPVSRSNVNKLKELLG